MTEQNRVPQPVSGEMASAREVGFIARAGIWLLLITGLLFTLVPALDLAISAIFVTEEGRFALAVSPFWRGIRWVFLRSFAIWYVIIVVALFVARGDRPFLYLTWPKWLFMGICALIGPLLVTNIWLKEEWGRWRPREITEFGGVQEYTSPLNPTGDCLDNCSFVSGEVSSTVMAMFALAMVSGAWRYRFYWFAIVLGAISALIRVGQGGHFMSDTLFAAGLMMLIAAGVYRLMFLGSAPIASQVDVDWDMLVQRHDALWARVCRMGLSLLDSIAPRR